MTTPVPRATGATTGPPPIPVRLAHRPVQAGMAVPWVALALPDGSHDFGGCEGRKTHLAMLDGLCQVCGTRIDDLAVFLAGDDQLDDMTFDVPPCHPECAAYSIKACPMVAGRLATYRSKPTRAARSDTCAEPGCDCGGWTLTDDREPGLPAPAWFTVWCRTYNPIAPSQRVVDLIRAGHAVPGARILARVTNALKIRPVAQEQSRAMNVVADLANYRREPSIREQP